MKKYQNLSIKIIVFTNYDVITTSGFGLSESEKEIQEKELLFGAEDF